MNHPAHKIAPQNHPISWSFSRSNSNGKEKDWESGFHLPRRGFEHHNGKYNAVKNYGARYYWSEMLTGWLSVDPMADKYPGISPYAYCVWNPVKLVDPEGEEAMDDWYKNGNDYYWSDNVVNINTTPKGCEYIGDDNALYMHFGLSGSSEPFETSQMVQTLVGTNAESSNPYAPKYYTFGTVKANANSSIRYSIQKDEMTGELRGLTINASLETTVTDNRSGGYAAAFLDVSYGDVSRHEPFRGNKGYAFVPRDIYTHKYLNASVTVSASKLSENCFSKLQINGSWFSNERPMTIPFTLGIFPSSLKHKYK